MYGISIEVSKGGILSRHKRSTLSFIKRLSTDRMTEEGASVQCSVKCFAKKFLIETVRYCFDFDYSSLQKKGLLFSRVPNAAFFCRTPYFERSSASFVSFVSLRLSEDMYRMHIFDIVISRYENFYILVFFLFRGFSHFCSTNCLPVL